MLSFFSESLWRSNKSNINSSPVYRYSPVFLAIYGKNEKMLYRNKSSNQFNRGKLLLFYTNFALSPGKISLYPFIAQCKFPLCLIKIVMSLRMRGTFLFKVQVVMSSSSLITWPRPKNKGDVSEFMNLLKLFIWSLPGPRSGKKNRSVEEV